MSETGRIVFSKAGRDKGMAFVVVSVCGDYLYLADGRLRRLDKPKKKKRMHVQATNYISESLVEKIAAGCATDSDIRKLLTECFCKLE